MTNAPKAKALRVMRSAVDIGGDSSGYGKRRRNLNGVALGCGFAAQWWGLRLAMTLRRHWADKNHPSATLFT
jgi:hypothetical protein